jgi:hypothetical protein
VRSLNNLVCVSVLGLLEEEEKLLAAGNYAFSTLAKH